MGSNVTVVIPAYNAARFIDETLKSVLAQTVLPDEIIVVDDGSTDDTAGRAAAFGAPVRLVRCARNSGGCSLPRNLGIAAATTRYVMPFDSDDVMLPASVERHLALSRAAPEAGVFFGDFLWLNPPPGMRAEQPHSRRCTVFWKYLEPLGDRLHRLPQPQALAAMLAEYFLGASSLMFEKSAWQAVGGYDEKMRYGEDMDFAVRLARKFSFGFVDEPVYRYRLHAGNKSGDRVAALTSELAILGPYLTEVSEAARPPLLRRLGEAEYDLSWHLMRAGRTKDAFRHWLQASHYGVGTRPLWRFPLRLAAEPILRRLRPHRAAAASPLDAPGSKAAS